MIIIIITWGQVASQSVCDLSARRVPFANLSPQLCFQPMTSWWEGGRLSKMTLPVKSKHPPLCQKTAIYPNYFWATFTRPSNTLQIQLCCLKYSDCLCCWCWHASAKDPKMTENSTHLVRAEWELCKAHTPFWETLWETQVPFWVAI